MPKFILSFVGNEKIELFETLFFHPLINGERQCIRGRDAGAYVGYGTFKWTRAVQALSLLAVRAIIREKMGITGTKSSSGPLLIGEGASLASSLDYAIDKQPNWLCDMFGTDSAGLSLIRRLVLRSNSGGKYPGPVALSFNTAFFSAKNIQIFCNSKKCESLDDLIKLEKNLLGSNTSKPVHSGERSCLDMQSDKLRAAI